jgi:serine O-acetyltransferase
MLERLKLKHKLPGITDQIVATYGHCQVPLHHLGNTPLPSRESIVQILEILQEIVFPGYFGKKGLDSFSIKYHVGDSLETVYEMLFREIYRGIRHDCQLAGEHLLTVKILLKTQAIHF